MCQIGWDHNVTSGNVHEVFSSLKQRPSHPFALIVCPCMWFCNQTCEENTHSHCFMPEIG